MFQWKFHLSGFFMVKSIYVEIVNYNHCLCIILLENLRFESILRHLLLYLCKVVVLTKIIWLRIEKVARSVATVMNIKQFIICSLLAHLYILVVDSVWDFNLLQPTRFSNTFGLVDNERLKSWLSRYNFVIYVGPK